MQEIGRSVLSDYGVCRPNGWHNAQTSHNPVLDNFRVADKSTRTSIFTLHRTPSAQVS